MIINRDVLDNLFEFDEYDYFKTFVHDEWFLGECLDEAVSGYIDEFPFDERMIRFLSRAVIEFGANNMLNSVGRFFTEFNEDFVPPF